MFSEKFRQNQQFLSQFFEAALNENSKLNHSYIFTGSDPMEQYFAALEVAKVLNCENGRNRTRNCNCTNCLWIQRNRHPAVITISPIDYTYGNKDSKASTVISVHQARYLKESLSTSSLYYRVIIFTDAVENKENESQAVLVWKSYKDIISPPALDNNSYNERPFWLPMPIKQETFNTAAPNALLKTIEEPEERVIFFFLAQDKEDIIDTIISRCQVLPVRSTNKSFADIDIFNRISDCFPPKDPAQALYLVEKLVEITKQESLSAEDILDSLQEYFKNLLENNSQNRVLSLRFIDYINKIEKAKNELNNYLNPQIVFESLLLGLL